MSVEIQSSTLEQWQEMGARAHAESTPVFLPGLARHFLSEGWSPAYFASLYPDIKVVAAVKLPEGGVPFKAPSDLHYREMEMREFLDLLASGASCYLSQVPLHKFPGLLNQVRPSALGLSSIKAVNVWIGSATRSGLHFDYGDNMFAQLYGRKRVFLIDPKFSRFLYQFPDVPSKSRLDPEHPDLERFPRFANCEVIQCRLGPGDLLFIPRGWWHFVAAEDISVSVNCWHGNSLTWLDFARLYLAGGPQVVLCCVRDFVRYGLLGRKYQRRLFSPPALGVEAYEHLRSLLTRKNTVQPQRTAKEAEMATGRAGNSEQRA